MKKLILAFILFFFSTSVLYADPIEGSWHINKSKMKHVFSSLPKKGQDVYDYFVGGFEDVIFYKGGKLTYPLISLTGTWQKSGHRYLLITGDNDITQAYFNENMLKVIPPKAFPFKQAIVYTRPSQASNNIIQKVTSVIQYKRKYYRTTKNKDGSQTYLIIDNKTCSFITPNSKGSGHSKTSGSCSVYNRQIHMGAFLGKAQILSANRIKHGKNIYTLRQNASKKQKINPYFIGRWENMSSYNKSEMSEIFFVIKNAKLTVDILFSCPPTDCGWGKGKVLAIENAGKTIKLIYDSSFSGVTKLLNIHLADKKLTIETTIRHDDSRKKDIITQNFLRKVPLLTSAQIRAKRLAEWYKAHPEQRPKK